MLQASTQEASALEQLQTLTPLAPPPSVGLAAVLHGFTHHHIHAGRGSGSGRGRTLCFVRPPRPALVLQGVDTRVQAGAVAVQAEQGTGQGTEENKLTE